MNISETIIHIVWTYLVKVDIYEDWHQRIYAKQVIDQDLWEELQYGWTEVKGPTKEPVTSIDEVKKMLLHPYTK